MATLPTHEEAGRRVLWVMVDKFGCRTGEVLRSGSFLSHFNEARWGTDELNDGLVYALNEKWITHEGDTFRLTALGFNEAGTHEMNLSGFCRDTVSIERSDGSRHDNVKAQVNTKSIIIPNEKIPVSIGDVIIRTLPSGVTERLVVTEPGFTQGTRSIPSHYSIKYRHESAAEKVTGSQTFHVSGPNARVNINSNDYSNNLSVQQIEQQTELLAELQRLRLELFPQATQPEHAMTVGAIAEAEMAVKENNKSKLDAAIERLGTSGRWIWTAAQKIAYPVISKIIEHKLGY